MKLISELQIEMKKGALPLLITELFRHGIDVNILLELLNKSTDKFLIHSVTHSFEDMIKGGLINVTGKIDLEHENDYQMGLLGASELIHEKVNEGKWGEFIGISKNIGLFCGMTNSENLLYEETLHSYINAERDV